MCTLYNLTVKSVCLSLYVSIFNLFHLSSLKQSDSQVEYKHGQIVKTDQGEYILSGAKKSFSSLRELLHCYQKEALRSDGHIFKFTKCCPPKAKGERSGDKGQQGVIAVFLCL